MFRMFQNQPSEEYTENIRNAPPPTQGQPGEGRLRSTPGPTFCHVGWKHVSMYPTDVQPEYYVWDTKHDRWVRECEVATGGHDEAGVGYWDSNEVWCFIPVYISTGKVKCMVPADEQPGFVS
jgi:hypothetical protein